MNITIDESTLIIIGFVALILLSNIYTTYLLYKTDQYEKIQKIIQFFIIWLIPILGIVFVSHFLDKNKSNNNDTYQGTNTQAYGDSFDSAGSGE